MTKLLKNVFRGAGTVLDIGSGSNHYDKVTKRHSNSDAIAHDWRQVGKDIQTAIGRFELNEQQREKE